MNLDLYQCDNVTCNLSKGNIRGISAIIQSSDDIEDFFYIPFLNNGKGYCISMYRPEYMEDPEIKMSDSDKKDLVELLNSDGWNKLVEAFGQECGEHCLSVDCKHRFRNLPKNPPDYNLL